LDGRAGKRLKLIASAGLAGTRLDAVLAGWLPEALGRPVSKAKVRKLIMAGAVQVNGSRVRNAAIALSPGATIEAHVDPSRLFDDLTARDKRFELTPARILFEDADLIAIDKPSGLPAHPTLDEGRDNLVAAVTRFLAKRDGRAPYIGLHHRLDRDTSGVVLFTKSQRVNAAVAEAFTRRRVVKIYQALAGSHRKLDSEWTIKNQIGKISTKSKRAKYGAVDSDGQAAETSFRVIEQHPHGIWIEAVPRTGRTHQIRVHLAEYGLPILGDDLYGEPSALAPRLMLHASRLTFPHPITGAEVIVKSPLPGDFKSCLNRIAG
jgi:RluA family pseudouridine synthase